MKKRSFAKLNSLLVVLLFISTIFAIVFGKVSFDNKTKNQVVSATATTPISTEETQAVSPTNTVEPDQDFSKQTVIQYLVNESKQYGSARISFLGSSIKKSIPKESTWLSLLQSDLKTKNKGLEQLGYIITDYETLTTSEIIEEKKVDGIVQQVPTLILFETGVLNDYQKNVPIETTEKNLEVIMNQFQEKAPNAKILLLSPNRGTLIGANSTGLKAKEYIDRTNEFFKTKGWSYINIYEGFEKQRVKNGRALTQVLLSDGQNPNEIGHQYIFNTVKEYLTQQGE